MAEQSALYTNANVKKNDRSEVTITAEIPVDVLARHRARALVTLGSEVTIPGFRKGHVPEDILVSRLGEATILEEAAESALQEVYPALIRDHSLDVIGRPNIQITKLAPGNPVAFSVTAALMPEVQLPDYRAIARKEVAKREPAEVTDKEFDETLLAVRKNLAHLRFHQEHGNEHAPGEPEPEPIELTDESVKQLGQFDSVDDFKKKLRENMVKEKELKIRDKQRAAILDTIAQKATIGLPSLLIDAELEKMAGQFKDDVARAGISFDEYLTRIKKTETELRAEWRPDAEKRARIQLVLNEIAKQEKLTVPTEKIEQEVARLAQHYKDADPMHLRVFVITALLNEEVLKLLESTGSEEGAA
jgi:FKBP-type peptidyl-prolyl cis-trans isomerase (trigger factor)